MAQSHKDAAVEFLELVAAGDVQEAFRRHVAPGFRHHNPFFRGDAASLMEAMEDNAASNPATGSAGCAADRIAELWDVGQAVPERSVNEHGMF